MYTAGEDRSEHDPQESGRAVEDTHDSAEDRSESGYVEELYQEDSPRSHRHEVHAIGLGQRRRLAIGLDTEDFFNQHAVGEKTYYQQH